MAKLVLHFNLGSQEDLDAFNKITGIVSELSQNHINGEEETPAKPAKKEPAKKEPAKKEPAKKEEPAKEEAAEDTGASSKVTLEDIREVLSKKVAKHKAAIRKYMQETYGVSNVSHIDKKDYPAFLEHLKSLK